MTALEWVVKPKDGDHIVSWSEVSQGRRCPHAHELAYFERWSKVQPDHTALGKGTMWHSVLETHYLAIKDGRDHRAAVAELVAEWHKTGRNAEVIEVVMWMYDGHLQRYGIDPQWEIIAVEYPFEFPLHNADGSPTRFKVKGKIDLIVRDRTTRRVFVVDHKSCSALPSDKELELDDQMGLYLWGLRSLGKNPFAVVYSAARTAMNKGDHPGAVEAWERAKAAGEKPGQKPKQQDLDARFLRHYSSRTNIEMDNIEQETLATAEFLYSDMNRHQRHNDPDRCRYMCGMLEACRLGRKTTPERERQFLVDTGWTQSWVRH